MTTKQAGTNSVVSCHGKLAAQYADTGISVVKCGSFAIQLVSSAPFLVLLAPRTRKVSNLILDGLSLRMFLVANRKASCSFCLP